MIIERVKQTKRDERKTDCLNLDFQRYIFSRAFDGISKIIRKKDRSMARLNDEFKFARESYGRKV